GKTTLAVEAGRRLAEADGLGLLYLDLRGMDPDPLDTGTALLRLLKALGAGVRDIPDDVAGRSGQLRALWEARPAVLVLDNAREEEQVRPLLPGAGRGLVLVTSRRLLTGLEGVERLPVPVFEPAEARSLLSSIIGGADGPRGEGLADLAGLCGGLPLALRIIGNRLATRPAWTARQFADRLADSERRLEGIHAGDLQITAAFSMSYEQLSPAAQRLCRRLALVPGPDFTAVLACVLTGASLYDTEDLLDELHELGLLALTGEHRFGFHDLIRLFAGERLAAEEDAARRTALTRALAEWLLEVTAAAAAWFDPAHGAAPADWGRPVELSSAEAAEAWLRAESDNWFGAVRVATEQGWDGIVLDTVDRLHWFANQWLLWPHWHELFTLAGVAARRAGDPAVCATQLYNLSWAQAQRGELEQAAASALEAARIAERAGAVRQHAWALHYAARAVTAADPAAALAYNQRAERLFAQVEDWVGHTTVLTSIGISFAGLGAPREAVAALRAALDEARRPPSGAAWQTIADVLATSGHYHLGATYEAMGEFDPAEDAFRFAAGNAGRIGMRLHQGRAEVRLGLVLQRRGLLEQAAATLEAARAHFLEVDAAAEAGGVEELLAQCRAPA
ncbi:hypothetical protein KDL01_35480, partial [Actinospica durhamensis]